MQLTSQQQDAVSAFSRGENVKVIAVPGAGKSRVLVQTCLNLTHGICIILAYNRELKEETEEKISSLGLSERVMCYTYHGLCSKCLRLSPDDLTLHQTIDDAEQDSSLIVEKLRVDAILIDEAQDFRPSFLRLLKLVIVPSENAQFMVVGDHRQMLYNYNPEDTASSDFLLEAEEFFKSNNIWNNIEFDISHRLSQPMARFVSDVFDDKIESSQTGGLPVEINTVNMWQTGMLVLQILKACDDVNNVCLLVARRRNNTPLTTCLNFLSKNGINIHIHGVDGVNPNTRKKKLSVSSWHASKGMEYDVAIVFGVDEFAQKNPYFVALTRGRKRLVIFQNKDSLNPLLMTTLKEKAYDSDTVILDEQTKMVLKTFDTKAPQEKKEETRKLHLVDLNEWRPKCSGRWILKYVSLEKIQPPQCECTDMTISVSEKYEDVSNIYKSAILKRMEHETTGTIQQLMDFNMPLRKSHSERVSAIQEGIQARFVSEHATQEALLQNDLRACTLKALRKPLKDTEGIDYMYIACGMRSWNSYHHMMRQVLPLTWFDEVVFEMAYESFWNNVKKDGEQTSFDIRLHKVVEDVTFHARTSIYSVNKVWRETWSSEISNEDILRAALCASLHPLKSTCFIYNIPTQELLAVHVENPMDILHKIAQITKEDENENESMEKN